MPSSPVLSSDFQKAALASSTAEVYVCLVEIKHPLLSEPVRLSSDLSGNILQYDEETGRPIYHTRHNGHNYIGADFSFIPPGTPDENTIPSAKFTVATQPAILVPMREIHEAATFTAIFVLASDPETVINRLPDMILTSVDYDAAQITGTLDFDHFLNEPVPRVKFYPSFTPALFKGGVS